MIEIEFEEPNRFSCECCGNESVSLTRFVYKDGDAHGVYYARFTIGHEDKVVYGLISLGEWGEGSEPKDRRAFPFRIWTKGENYQVGLTNKEDSPWSHADFLGKMLDREEALKHPWIKEVFHITDHMVSDDALIVDYL